MDDRQDRADIRIEYEYQPSPDGGKRLAIALDLVVMLLLEDLRRFPPSPSQPGQRDGTE